MSIFTRWADEVSISKDHGIAMVRRMGEVFPVTLVEIKYADTAETDVTFAEYLRADEGWTEISAAVSAADKEELSMKWVTRLVKKRTYGAKMVSYEPPQEERYG